MRYAIKTTLAATLVAGVAATGHHHQHAHFHAKKDASPVEKREDAGADATVYVAGAVETVFELNGELLTGDEAKEGIDLGNFVVVGESVPTVKPPPPPPKPTTTSQAPDLGAQFIEKTTSSSPPPEPTTSAAPKPSPSPKPAPPSNGGSSGGSGLTKPFPDGEIDCSHFPSDYGAVGLSWLGTSEWSGLQFVPDYSVGDLSISNIVTGIVGDSCSEGCMCSYACPPGYQKSQYPKAQGSTKQSIGGLYCNSDGKLELTKKNENGDTYLCEKGEGGISIKNELNKVACTCRTDYPGTESMVIPTCPNPGETLELCNPKQDYYIWDDSKTSAQYYLNKEGYDVEDACVWDSPIDLTGAGDKAPVIIGVGYDAGTTWLSIFQNIPMNTHGKLGYNVEILGGNSECSLIDGVWSGGDDTGCTVSAIYCGTWLYTHADLLRRLVSLLARRLPSVCSSLERLIQRLVHFRYRRALDFLVDIVGQPRVSFCVGQSERTTTTSSSSTSSRRAASRVGGGFWLARALGGGNHRASSAIHESYFLMNPNRSSWIAACCAALLWPVVRRPGLSSDTARCWQGRILDRS